MPYVIDRWENNYEVNKRPDRTESLSFFKWKVLAHTMTADYRRLLAIVGPELLPAALGVFGKCGEMAAAERRDNRDGTVFADSHQPATVNEIAWENGFDESVVARCLDGLVGAGWLRLETDDQWLARRRWQPPANASGGERQAAVASGRPPSPALTETETETLTETKTKTERNSSPARVASRCDSDSDSGPHEIRPHPQDPSPPRESLQDASQGGSAAIRGDGGPATTGHAGIRETAVRKLACVLGVPDRIQRQRLDARGQTQAKADETCLRKIVEFVIDDPTELLARQQADQLMRLARAPGLRNRDSPIRGFIAECKQRWPGVFPAKDRKEAMAS